MPKPDADLTTRHPAFGASFNGRSWIQVLRTPPILLSLLSPDRYRQIWCPHITCIDSPPRNFSVVIYAFRSFEPNRKAAFEIIEVCRVGTLIPNNGTTIDKVRVA